MGKSSFRNQTTIVAGSIGRSTRFSLKTAPLAFTLLLSACGNSLSVKPPEKPATKTFDAPPINKNKDRKGDIAADLTNWFTKGPENEGVEGTDTERAYKELGLQTSAQPIIVAVIDGGVDITHEDLQGHLWVNTKEIPGNGIDDDGNGYIDDVNGWNFLGGYDKDGKIVDVNAAPLEQTRESARLKKLKVERETQGKTLTADETKLLADVSAKVAKGLKEAQDVVDDNTKVMDRFKTDYDALKDVLNIPFEKLTLIDLKNLKTQDQALDKRRDDLVTYAAEVNFTDIAKLQSRLDYWNGELKYSFNESFDPRADIIGDDPNDFSNRKYGNPDVRGGDPDHGTHVSGIIAAVRDNGLGINGIATDVRIMVIRAVPNGDEYDKDVANAVRYAVDNGARIINMSFGKDFSPHKSDVDAAFKYAASKNVLIVHAAGNSAQNTDVQASFPNPYVLDSEELVPGWMDVGASAAKRDFKLAAEFSNYGTKTVEIFAPGVDIVSSVPYETALGHYDSYSGTSMASPVVAGVAALVLSQHPELTAAELRKVLMTTSRQYTEQMVRLPFELAPPVPTFTYFSALSQTGGIVDAYEALRSLLK